MGMIQENSQEAIVRNPAVPNQQNEDVMQTLMGSITGGLQQEAQSGNMGGIMGLLSGRSASPSNSSGLMSNPIVAGIAGKAIHSIMRKIWYVQRGGQRHRRFGTSWCVEQSDQQNQQSTGQRHRLQ